MPGVGGGGVTYGTVTGDIDRPTADTVWQLLLVDDMVVVILDRRDALANSIPSGTEAYCYPMAEFYDVADGTLRYSVKLDATSPSVRSNWTLYDKTPLMAKAGYDADADQHWVLVVWGVRQLSPSVKYTRAARIVVKDAVATLTLQDFADGSADIPAPVTGMGTLALDQQIIWGSDSQIILGATA